MTSITVIAGPEPLTEVWLSGFAQRAAQNGLHITARAWVQEGKAAVLKTAQTADATRQMTVRALGNEQFDVIVQDQRAKPKRFLVADMESTIIEQEMLDELAEKLGIGAQVKAITARAMNGELDFRQAIQQRVALLKGQPEKMLLDLAGIITPSRGASDMMAAMQNKRVTCWLVSGGFRTYTRLVAREFNFHREYGNDLVVENGVLTGEVAEPLLGKAAKLEILQAGLTELHVSAEETIAIGDGANDVPMLEYVHQNGGLGIAYRAKPNVRAQIPNQINHSDLSALGYLL